YGVPEYLAAASIAMLGIPLVRQITTREPFVLSPPLVPLLVYVAVVLLSAATAGYDAGERVGIVLTEGLLLFLLLSNAVRTVDTLRQVIWALLLAGALMSLVTIHQAVTGNYESNYAGFAVVEQGFEVDVQGEAVRQPRAAGPVGEKNRYAQVLLVLVPLAIGRMKDAKGRRRKLLAAGVTASILAAAAMQFIRWRTLLATAAGLLAIAILLSPTFVGRVISIGNAAELFSDGGDEAEGAIVGRATSNLAAFNVLMDHPLLGVGPGLYGPYYSVDYANRLGLRHFDEPRRAHNLFLEVGAETGLLGLAAFIATILATVIPLWRVRRRWRHRNAEYANLATALLLSLLGYFTAGLFLHLAYERYLWIIVALAASTIWILTPESARWAAERLRRAPIERAAAA
ncbi:MAG TPA: O-antigen ligase family protein, partial [Candidatus Limnocylindria bacterium]